MMEGIKTDVLGLQTKLSKVSIHKSIQLGDVSIQLGEILNSQTRKMKRLFNYIPGHLRDITIKPTEYLKKQLDEWLNGKVPAQPKCGIYAGRVLGASNSIDVQYLAKKHASNWS